MSDFSFGFEPAAQWFRPAPPMAPSDPGFLGHEKNHSLMICHGKERLSPCRNLICMVNQCFVWCQMGQVATVTSKSMVTIPAKIRSKYGIKEGSKVEFVENEDGILFVPLKTLHELRGALKDHEKAVKQGIRELNREHREEARS